MGGGDALLYRRGLYLIFPARRLHPAKFSRKNGAFSNNTNHFTGRIGIYFNPLCNGLFVIGIEAEGLPQPLHHFSFILYHC